jgi:hypothetical protein
MTSDGGASWRAKSRIDRYARLVRQVGLAVTWWVRDHGCVTAVDPGRAVGQLRRAIAQRRWAEQQRANVAVRVQQSLVDWEVQQTRRRLLQLARARGGARAVWFMDEDFLTLADPGSVQQAIVLAAASVGGANCADLQLYDPAGDVLRMAAHHGFGTEFLAYFGSLDRSQPTACATAWRTQRPVLVDDVSRSRIFAGKPTLEPLRDSGTRAVYSYPLLATDGEVTGVLSFHYNKRAERPSRTALIARCATEALQQVATTA